MTNQPQMIPADKVRAARDLHREAAKMTSITTTEREIHQHVADAMEAILPPPPRPTLEDMTGEERRECRLMQADVGDEVNRPVIVNPCWEEGRARVMWPGGFIDQVDWDRVTPRPDLPRMEWPSNKKADTSDAAPLNTLAMGIVWDDADALAQACRESESDHIVVVDKQGTVGVWDKGIRCWRVSAPHAKFAPYTIIHTGKKANR